MIVVALFQNHFEQGFEMAMLPMIRMGTGPLDAKGRNHMILYLNLGGYGLNQTDQMLILPESIEMMRIVLMHHPSLHLKRFPLDHGDF